MIDIVNMMFLDSPESGEGSSTRCPVRSEVKSVFPKKVGLSAGFSQVSLAGDMHSCPCLWHLRLSLPVAPGRGLACDKCGPIGELASLRITALL